MTAELFAETLVQASGGSEAGCTEVGEFRRLRPGQAAEHQRSGTRFDNAMRFITVDASAVGCRDAGFMKEWTD